MSLQKYYIWTIGCQMNKSESERLASYLEFLGAIESDSVDEADIIILNSCVVRQSAENRVINKLHSLKSIKKANPNLKIALTGCLVGENLPQLKKNFPFVDHYFVAGEFPDWLGTYDLDKTIPKNPKVATYIPIMQGCNNYCSYCIVPYRRGRERSRIESDIILEAGSLISRGVKEITLLGQNVNSYGNDIASSPDMADLLCKMNQLQGLERIRFLTNHPKDMKDKIIDAIAGLNKVCEQINLPVQAGDDNILQAMRRGYTSQQYLNLINKIRDKIPQIALSTDVIVGFPGETDGQFANTYELLEEIRFDMVHVAAYSPRSGTLAAKTLEDNIPMETKKARLEAIEKQQGRIVGEINSRLQDTTLEILVEGLEKGKWFGRTRTDKLVFFQSAKDYQSQLVRVKIKNTTPWSLIGEVLA